MRETFNSYLRKLVARTQNPPTRLSAEQTIEDKKATENSPQGKITTPLGKADHYAHLVEETSKKRRIPFVALALMVVFASLCILSLLQVRPVALAHNNLALDITPTPGIPEAAPQDQTVEFLEGESNKILGSGLSDSDCQNSHKLRLANPLAGAGDSFCWNQSDFSWGARDVTCIYNDMHGPQAADGSNWVGPAWDVNMVDQNDTALKIHLDAVPLNQNTCTDTSICLSDNASHNDNSSDPKDPIHDETGGDDILCGNSSCINDQHGTTTECGNPNGKQREYDRFACQMTSDRTSTLSDANWNTPPASEPDANFKEKRWWWSTGVAINPSAYDPNGALYLPTSNLRAAGIEPNSDLYADPTLNTVDTSEPTQDAPECNASGHWSCRNDNSIIVYQYNGNLTKSSDKNFADFYEEAVPHYSPDQFYESYGIGGAGVAAANGFSQKWKPGSASVPVYWVVCGSEGGWAFPCSDPNSSANAPFITTADKSQSLDNNQVAEGIIVKDWLSGDASPTSDSFSAPVSMPDNPKATPSPPPPPEPGHLAYTYLSDTINQPGVQELKWYMMGLGMILIAPVLVLIGYQLLWASWTLGRANAMEAFGRLLLSIMAISVSYQLAAMLIGLANTFNLAVVGFHVKLGYPNNLTIDNLSYTFTLAKQGENDPMSFRALVIPITRWGCVANDFVSLLSNKFWTDFAGMAPFVGGLVKLIGNVFNVIDVAKHIGEFLMLLLSINLCTQVFMRVVLLNYYVLTGPLAFGCWGLPGGVGQKVVSSWVKGFVSLLFAQTAQIFVLTTFPLILPPFPNLPTDNQFGILIIVFQALPRILVLMATIQIPKLMGTGATKAIAQAGTVAAGAVAAAGAAAMQTV